MGHTTKVFFEEDGVKVTEISVEASNDITVRFTPYDGVYHARCCWPSRWVDDDIVGEEFGFGETMAEDELEQRKREAVREATGQLADALE